MGSAVDGMSGIHAAGRFSPSRRGILLGSAAAAVMTTLSLGTPGSAASGTGYDPSQRYLSLFGIGNGQLLAIQADGALLWQRNESWSEGVGNWADGSGLVIGSGWNHFTAVMGSLNGTIYAVRGDGTLFRHQYLVADLETGIGTWGPSEQIGSGWNVFTEVIGFGGDFYGRTDDGTIYWSHYDNSTQRWTVVNRGLHGFDFRGHSLYADAGGVLYSYSGGLYWYRHVNGVWQSGSGAFIQGNLTDLSLQGMFFAGCGTFYYVRPDMPGSTPQGQMLMHRLRNFLTAGSAPSWTNAGIPAAVGAEWWFEPWAALQGYPITHSVVAGQNALIAVSTTFPQFSWTVLQIGGDKPVEVTPAQTGTQAGRIQMLPSGDYLSTGCGWKPSISISTSSLSSGLYAVRLKGPHGLTRDVPFIVNPPSATHASIAFLIPTLTHHAYNAWGGHNQYCQDLNGQQRFLNLNRPSRQKPIAATGRMEHTLYTDIMLLQWMNRQGYRVDVYDDVDLHRNPDLFNGYDIVVIGSHAEYWSLTMRQGLSDYLTGGGNVVYAGANGIFEAVDIDPARGLVTYRLSASDATAANTSTGAQVSVGSRRLMSMLGYPGSLLLGVAYRSITHEAPYQVEAPTGHPLLAGTGLVHGSLFGTLGYNGAASGWEVDAVLPGSPGLATPDQIIASGTNRGGGADMIYRPTGHGGAVFSASSITFVGALATDTAMSTLLSNVFSDMFGRLPAAALSTSSAAPSQPMQKTAPTAPSADQLADNH